MFQDGLNACCIRLAEEIPSYVEILRMVRPHFTSLARMAVDREIALSLVVPGRGTTQHVVEPGRDYILYVLGQELDVQNAIKAIKVSTLAYTAHLPNPSSRM